MEVLEHKYGELDESENFNTESDESSDDDGILDEPLSKKAKIDENDEESKQKSKTKNKPPTAEELNHLRETQNLFNSNLFRLQIGEMQKEITVKPKQVNDYNKWLTKFKKFVNSMTDSKERKLSDRKWITKQYVKMPLNELPNNTKSVFKFTKPSSVFSCGLFHLNSAIASPSIAHVAIEIPKIVFHSVDIFNAGYIVKRALYLTHIISQLKDQEELCKHGIEFSYQNGNHLKPIALIKATKHLTVVLQICVQKDTFKYSKFTPSKSRIKSDWYFEKNATDEDDNANTPFYNSSVLEDLTFTENYNMLQSHFNNVANINDGLRLLQVWFHQRHLDLGFGAFNTELMAMFVLYLIKNKKINNAMSSYQIVRHFWLAISQSNWDQKGQGISFCTSQKDGQPTLDEFHQHQQVVFVDVTGYYNLASFLSLEVYKKVKLESELAVKYLDNGNFNNFQCLFMTKMPFYRQFDILINIHNMDFIEELQEKIEENERLDYMFFKRPYILKYILNILKKGLGNRIVSIVPKIFPPKSWNINEDPQLVIDPFVIGVNLNQLNAFSALEKGPPANMPEALEFRAFWGEKSEMRRFNDGLISEAVVWSLDTTLCNLRKISVKIISFLLNEKCEIDPNSVNFIHDQATHVLCRDAIKFDKKYGTGEEVEADIVTNFDELNQQLRDLKNLPLEISSIQGISSIFRYTDVYPTIAQEYKRDKLLKVYKNNLIFDIKNNNCCKMFVPAYEACVQLALSGKWPNNIQAIRRLKAAFHMKISKCLSKQFGLICSPNIDYFDVLKNGFVFRLRVIHTKEITLLKKNVSEEGLTQYRDTPESLELEKMIVHLPQITGALHGLHNQEPSFGTAVRIAKRWIRSQMLDEFFIPDLVIELIMANLYLQPEPYTVSTLPQQVFIRFLDKISRTDWKREPLIVNFNNEITRDQITEIESTFSQTRSTLPSLFIATPYDQKISIWTRQVPSEQILLRIALLAKESLKLIEENIFNSTTFNWAPLFKPTLLGYNVIIHLKPAFNPRKMEQIQYSKQNKIQYEIPPFKNQEHIPIVNFDPVQLYLKELRESYDDFALFFHDSYGGDVICVLWKPNIFEEKEFKVSLVNGRRLDSMKSTETLKANLEGFIEDFQIIGGELVSSIEENN